MLVGLSSEQLNIDLNVVQKLLREGDLERLKDTGIPALQNVDNVQEYIVQFLLYLLHQKDKISADLLDNSFPVNLLTAWKRFLAIIEGQKRKLVRVKSGSLVLEVFCADQASIDELHNVYEDTDSPLHLELKNLLTEIGK